MRSISPGAPVLVTGATGFIGREVVRRLLAAGRPVVALARRNRDHSAGDRVAAAVGLVTPGGRLDVLEADLTQPGIGLGPSAWRRLRDTVELVIHAAGDTSFFPDAPAAFRAGHIDGPLELLRGLRTGHLRRWAHLSTAYVCGRRSGRVLEHEADVGQDFHNVYERVKLESELALRRAGARLGVDVRVFRPSIVVGAAPETAGSGPAHLFFGFIRLAARLARHANGAAVPLRIEAVPQAPFNIVPLEYVAAAVVAVAQHDAGTGETVHLVVRDAPSQEAMLAMITKRLGVRGFSLADARRGPLEDPSPLERQVARLLAGYRDYLEQDVRFDDTTARRLLRRCGVPGASLSPDAVDRLIDQALVMGGLRSVPEVCVARA